MSHDWLLRWLTNGWNVFKCAEARAGKTRLPRALEDLQSADPEKRQQATRALRQLGGPEAVAALIQAMEDPVPWVRSSAALAVGMLGPPEALEPLLVVRALMGADSDGPGNRTLRTVHVKSGG